MPKPDSPLSAVVVTGGKQYRVAPGDQILVDRIAAEPGSTVKLGRVLLLNDGGEVKVGSPAVDGLDVDAKVLAHRRGPRVEGIRYKSKKRVRVHHGGRAHLTALQIIAVGGVGVATAPAEAPEGGGEEAPKKGRAKAAPRKPAAEKAASKKGASDKPAAEAKAETQAQAAKADEPKKPSRRKKESE